MSKAPPPSLIFLPMILIFVAFITAVIIEANPSSAETPPPSLSATTAVHPATLFTYLLHNEKGAVAMSPKMPMKACLKAMEAVPYPFAAKCIDLTDGKAYVMRR